MRYTEARLEALAEAMMADLDKETVDFVPNFDETTEEPTVLPTTFPNLLVNGSTGIAVGMATNIPPHNMREVIDGVIARDRAARPVARDAGSRRCSRRSRAPTSRPAASSSAATASSRPTRPAAAPITLRAKATIEESKKGDKVSIVITEIPYQVNKKRLLENIAELVREKTIEGISDLRDESDRDGMRIVIELKRGEVPEVDPQQPLQAHAAADDVRHHHAGDRRRPAARCCRSSTSSSTSSSSGARSSGAAPSSSCARPRRARTSSKG